MIDKATNFLMSHRHRPLTFVAAAMLLAIPPVLAQTGAAFAEDQRFYVGIAVPAILEAKEVSLSLRLARYF